MLYLRHSLLVFDHLSKHPEAKQPESKAALRPLLKRMPAIIKQMEDLKPHINKAYDEWVKIGAAQRDTRESTKPTSAYQKYAATDPALSWNSTSRAKILDAGQHQELAVDLAQREIRRRDAARRATRQAGISDEEEQARRSAGLWDSWDTTSSSIAVDPVLSDEQDLRRQMEAARRMAGPSVDGDRHDERIHGRHGSRSGTHSQTYHYPSISKSTPLKYDPHGLELFTEPGRSPPPRPSKESIPQPQSYRYDSPPPPAVPRKELSQPPPYPDSYHEAIPELPPKTIESPAKQERLTFKPAAYLENGKPIRPVFLPDRLRKTFLEIASDNTRRGLEMCGILCGTLVNNALFISCLLIPEQKCTSDTCETENESAMLDFCINQDLLMLGWIHTHPTQTCFMSSRDLHTQAGYQVMMPESIAIVCAPRHTPSYVLLSSSASSFNLPPFILSQSKLISVDSRWGIFRLTDPPGLPHVLHCNHTDTFHQHAIDNIYTDAGNPPGHVYETGSLEFSVHDLRPPATTKR
jgi:STAM-binding protein